MTENIDQHMYLRQSIADGKADDGTPIEIATTGPHIIIQLGTFPNGRQFVISIADMCTAVLEHVTRPTVGGDTPADALAQTRQPCTVCLGTGEQMGGDALHGELVTCSHCKGTCIEP